MTQALPNKSYRAIGDGGSLTRRAVSYTPASDIILRHFSFIAMRIWSSAAMYTDALNEMVTITWEIRTGTVDNAPDTTAASLLDTGTIDWRYQTAWKMDRPIKYTVNLTSGLALSSGVTYFFILKAQDDEISAEFPLAWADTYVTGAASEVDDTVYCSEYIADGTYWTTGDNTYNLTLFILDEQAGGTWHTVIDGKGYMQPDKLRGYRCEQVSAGLAQSRGGQNEVSQLRYPYSNFSQSNWTTGSGQLQGEDLNSFLYALGVDTSVPNQMILGPQVYLTGLDTANPAYEPEKITALRLIDSTDGTGALSIKYYAQKFTTTDAVSMTTIGLRVNKMAWARRFALSVAIYSDAAGSPDAALGAGFVALGATYKWAWSEAALTLTLDATTDYWVVVKTSQTYGAISEHRIMFDQDGSYAGGAAKKSHNGVTWTDLTGYSLAFRINYGDSGALNGTVQKLVYGTVGGTAALFALAGKEVYKWNNTSGFWEATTAALTANGTDLICFANALWCAQGLANNSKYWNGTTWADAGYACNYYHIGKGYLWVSTAVNEIKHTNDGTTLSAAITCGENLWDITGFVNYQGKLLVGKEDGLWEVDDQDLGREYLLFREHADPNNCRGMVVWSGMLFIPVQSSIWRWQGSQYKEVGPADKRAGQTKDWPNKVVRMAATSSLLLGLAEPVVSTGFGGLVVYNGLGWHHLTLATRTNTDNRAICVTTEIGTDETRIWMGEGDRITYVKMPVFTNNRYDWTAATYDITGGSWVGSWWDGGLKDALKFWNRFTLIADIPTECWIDVYCARDGQDWTSTADFIWLGQLSQDHMTATGEYVLMFPDGMIAKSIQPIFVMNTTDNTKTPRIKAYNIESVVRQPPVYTYTFRLLLADNITKMNRVTESTRTANDMWTELQIAASRNEPIIISFPQKSIRGMISSLREETVQFKAEGMEEETWERIAVVAVVEAT